ncbi:MAG TPA: crotonyl-CoA carboxylase/reductase [Polyangiaceae bacterium]|nr:crotonyl-CoA carboxylase/reductase [Polyangiaceae bacterium]
MTASTKDLHPLGEMPPTGHVPRKMIAQVIRPERFGEPEKAFAVEEIDTPGELRPDEVLVWVMAAGVNYNNVWAALGKPIDVTKNRPKDRWFPDSSGFHVGGSDASGIVWKVGSAVRDLKVGDEVVVHCGQWSGEDPATGGGADPMFAPSFRIWGYETSWGSFAQFARVQAHQCLPKPKHLGWVAASSYMLVGATAYRMLMGWAPHTVRPGDPVLVWGGAGGLGCQAIQIVRALGGLPIAVVSDDEKFDFCRKLGAVGCINRTRFDHFGMPPHWEEKDAYERFLAGARSFGAAIWDALGERRNPRIVFEHPGEATIPTSIVVCDTGGMVVVCAGTTGYSAVSDLRYLWMRQKRLQGSHFANDEQARAFQNLVDEGRVDPCLSHTYGFDEIPLVHQLMYRNRHPSGNLACLVNAKTGD